jgi:membrane-bound lytic murein transglycosylase MltF
MTRRRRTVSLPAAALAASALLPGSCAEEERATVRTADGAAHWYGAPSPDAPAPPPHPDAPPPGPAGGESTRASAPADASFWTDEPALVLRTTEPAYDDWDSILERRQLRVLVTRSRTGFFVAEGRARGFELEMYREFEKAVNADLGRDSGPPFTIAFIPVEHERLLPALLEGHGDVAADFLTVTPEREAQVAFSDPYLTDVSEVVVHHQDTAPLRSLEDLAGKPIRVASGTSYETTLARWNRDLVSRGLAPMEVSSPGRALAQEDYLELVSAGIYDYTICDRHAAELWAEVLDGLVVRDDLALRTGGRIAWAVRKGNPVLKEQLDAFARENHKGTLIGNVLFHRYFDQTRWITHPLEDVGEEMLGRLRAPLEKYSAEYGFDWRLMAAQAYQESGLDPAARSRSGAIGLMQLLPATAKDMGFDDVTGVDANLHAGIKYMAWLRDHYFSDPGVPAPARVDFALAAYNAGVGRVRRWRSEAPDHGLDPNRWYGHVEKLALADVGLQPVHYVANIEKYFLAFTLLLDEGERERAEIERLKEAAGR